MTTYAIPSVDDIDSLSGLDAAQTLSRGHVPADAPILFVIPAFNEAENLPRLLRDLQSRPDLVGGQNRVIVVDDGSSDGTADIAESYASELQIDVVRLPENLGPGAAFRAGFAAALGSCDGEALVVTLEADTTSDLDVLPTMLACARTNADLVLASVHGGGRMINVGFVRRTLSRGAGAVIRHALGVDARTVSSFFRVYRASLLRAGGDRYGEDLIREKGFACKAELLTKLGSLGARVQEVPVDLDASRRVGESKMRVGETLVGYWRLIARERLVKGSR
jgi:dolichol-phosphate mannosyltransferase